MKNMQSRLALNLFLNICSAAKRLDVSFRDVKIKPKKNSLHKITYKALIELKDNGESSKREVGKMPQLFILALRISMPCDSSHILIILTIKKH